MLLSAIIFLLLTSVEPREYDGLKRELKSIYEEKEKQAMLRAKCRWIENSERPTKYFFQS